jgi:Fe-S cluster biogenesis protein NfuA
MPVIEDFQERIQSIDGLMSKVESAADPSLRADMRELLRILMDLYGTGVERMLELIHASADGDRVIERLGRDELVSGLLVLHGLHPLDIHDRIVAAIDTARSQAKSHGAEVELLGIEEGAVRVRVQINGHGCGSSGEGVKKIIEDAVYRVAPDVTSLVIEGVEQKHDFVPLEMLQTMASVAQVGK